MAAPERISRRRLPHWYVAGAAHFITYRLHNSLPAVALEELRQRKEMLSSQKPPAGSSRSRYREQIHKKLFAIYDRWLDRGDRHWLSDPRVAAVVRSNLYHHDGVKYRLISYCIMSNHVHVLLQPIDLPLATGGPPLAASIVATGGPPVARNDAPYGASTGGQPVATLPIGELSDKISPLARIMHSLKSYTAHEANKILNRLGPFWQSESYDHWVRDDDEMERIVNYIRANPVQAGLIARPEEWLWSSCHDRFLVDGDVCGWLKFNSTQRRAGGPPAGASV